ncbi:ParB/RepB/Spo0J family partition protein [Methyloversatilis thermotolerans]|uniref:ParB/RepB/Spo0J family partition protein n=1 Tax=Methyloversatilis thermotolerans TaxID=1346290 RepID=UPI0012FC911E|nr:ParB/RepB/Spo0J family partition protein [Methyloversatilis thermotolerans]
MTTTSEKKATPAKAVKKTSATAAKTAKPKRPELASVANVVLVPLDDLVTDQNIREAMDEEALQQLARDIEVRGLLQPIVVTPAKGNKYQVVAGHRRAAAVRLTTATAVPAVVTKFSTLDAKKAQLAENIQREDLTLLEEGRALLALRDEGMTLAELGGLVNKSRSWVCKRIACVDELPSFVAQLVDEEITEDPEVVLTLKELSGLDWGGAYWAATRLRAGEENRDSLRELVRKAKEPKADLVGQMNGGDGDTAARLRQTDEDASPEAQAKREAEQERYRQETAEMKRKSRAKRQCGMWELLSVATLDEEPNEAQLEIYAHLEPEARAYWNDVINDALDGDLLPKMMERAAVAALEEEPDVLPVMLWVAMQPKPLPESEEEVLRGFLRDFRGTVVSHAKR